MRWAEPAEPALRAGDTALCPLTDRLKPHVGGPITSAAVTNGVLGDLTLRGLPIASGPGLPAVVIER